VERWILHVCPPFPSYGSCSLALSYRILPLSESTIHDHGLHLSELAVGDQCNLQFFFASPRFFSVWECGGSFGANFAIASIGGIHYGDLLVTPSGAAVVMLRGARGS
jgi:hypothetical protein